MLRTEGALFTARKNGMGYPVAVEEKQNGRTS
jgi:hypothetical protein